MTNKSNVYVRIADIKEPNCRVNLYGVICKVLKECQISKGYTLVALKDESCLEDQAFCVHFFTKRDLISPKLELGSIVRLRNVKIEKHQGVLDGRVFSTFDVVTFPEDGEGMKNAFYAGKRFSISDVDEKRLAELRRWLISLYRKSFWDTTDTTYTDSELTLNSSSSSSSSSFKQVSTLSPLSTNSRASHLTSSSVQQSKVATASVSDRVQVPEELLDSSIEQELTHLEHSRGMSRSSSPKGSHSRVTCVVPSTSQRPGSSEVKIETCSKFTLLSQNERDSGKPTQWIKSSSTAPTSRNEIPPRSDTNKGNETYNTLSPHRNNKTDIMLKPSSKSVSEKCLSEKNNKLSDSQTISSAHTNSVFQVCGDSFSPVVVNSSTSSRKHSKPPSSVNRLKSNPLSSVAQELNSNTTTSTSVSEGDSRRLLLLQSNVLSNSSDAIQNSKEVLLKEVKTEGSYTLHCMVFHLVKDNDNDLLGLVVADGTVFTNISSHTMHRIRVTLHERTETMQALKEGDMVKLENVEVKVGILSGTCTFAFTLSGSSGSVQLLKETDDKAVALLRRLRMVDMLPEALQKRNDSTDSVVERRNVKQDRKVPEEPMKGTLVLKRKIAEASVKCTIASIETMPTPHSKETHGNISLHKKSKSTHFVQNEVTVCRGETQLAVVPHGRHGQSERNNMLTKNGGCIVSMEPQKTNENEVDSLSNNPAIASECRASKLNRISETDDRIETFSTSSSADCDRLSVCPDPLMEEAMMSPTNPMSKISSFQPQERSGKLFHHSTPEQQTSVANASVAESCSLSSELSQRREVIEEINFYDCKDSQIELSEKEDKRREFMDYDDPWFSQERRSSPTGKHIVETKRRKHAESITDSNEAKPKVSSTFTMKASITDIQPDVRDEHSIKNIISNVCKECWNADSLEELQCQQCSENGKTTSFMRSFLLWFHLKDEKGVELVVKLVSENAEYILGHAVDTFLDDSEVRLLVQQSLIKLVKMKKLFEFTIEPLPTASDLQYIVTNTNFILC